VVVFVSVVSPTTTVCGSFVGAVGGGGGGAASSVVLQFIVRTCYVLPVWYHFFIPGLSSPVQDTFRARKVTVSRRVHVVRVPGSKGTDGGIKSNEYTHMYVMYKTGYKSFYISSFICQGFFLIAVSLVS